MPRPSAHHKGLLLVATYGTGKTHFMSCIAGVAVNAELAADLTDAPTAEAAAAIARKFGVIRVEIGAVQRSLRDIPATELTKGLAELRVEYSSPPLDKVTNNKQPVQQMMAASGERYPEHGLLLAIDELLDHLRTRRDMAIAFDPVHPAYLCTFEALTIVEKRWVLSTSDGAPRRRGSRHERTVVMTNRDDEPRVSRACTGAGVSPSRGRTPAAPTGSSTSSRARRSRRPRVDTADARCHVPLGGCPEQGNGGKQCVSSLGRGSRPSSLSRWLSRA